jgi:hypothetical protein
MKKGFRVVYGAVFVVGVLTLVRIGQITNFWPKVLTLFSAPAPPEVDVTTVIIQQIRGASELTTAVFGMQVVVPTQQDRNVLGQVTIGTTSLLYIAYGEVKAGVDLSQIQTEDVRVTPDLITIPLPPAQILDRKIDVERSQVYAYDRGFLGLGPDTAPKLQTLASQAALNQIVAVACEHNILGQAQERAALVVEKLLGATTETTIVVESLVAEQTDCDLENP